MGRGRKGPTPSCLPPPVPAAGEVVDHETVRAVMERTCWDKRVLWSEHYARQTAARMNAQAPGPVHVEAYRCPFHTATMAKHYHVGHTPPQWKVEQLAAVLRWCQAHPDDLPTP